MRLTTKFTLFTLIFNVLISFLWIFLNIDLFFTPFGIIINPIFIIPGIIALAVDKTIRTQIFQLLKKFGKFSLYVLSFSFNLCLLIIIFVIGIYFKILPFKSVSNLETQLLGVIFDFPLFIAIWLPSIFFNELGWRVFLIENIQSKSKFISVLISSILFSISFIIISFYYIIQKEVIFGITFFLSLFILSINLGLFYNRSRSIWLTSFHHITFIVLNSLIFGSIFQEGSIFDMKTGITNAYGLIGLISNILLTFLLYKILKTREISNSHN